jgi:hypothetical protein
MNCRNGPPETGVPEAYGNSEAYLDDLLLVLGGFVSHFELDAAQYLKHRKKSRGVTLRVAA